jgi:3-deoxy-D-manno-octulosonate 8-phosphate phosphatase (KDO 8-P phosphatase)
MPDFNKIKLLILDCDGVLTDGKIIYDENRIESKNFNAKDGLGIKLLSFTPIQVAVITGRESTMLQQRCQDLNITMLFQKIRNKLQCAEKLLNTLHLQWDEIAYMGDDWNDFPVMKQAGVKAVPQDAFSDLKELADVITDRNGGEGAVRELINLILQKQGIYEKTVEKFIQHLETI